MAKRTPKTPIAYRRGRKQAKAALQRWDRRLKARTGKALGTLVAEGDSWFDYPFSDVLDQLEDYGWDVVDVAHKGDNLEDMAHNERQLDDLTKMFAKLRDKGISPKAILLSGGGNDIAGQEFGMLLNHAASRLPVVNDPVVTGIIDVRLHTAMMSLIGRVTQLSSDCFQEVKPVLLHGYAYAVPDGRAFWGGGWLRPGPWLAPGFAQKGYVPNKPDEPVVLERNAKVLKGIMNRYNDMLKNVAKCFKHVTFIDLRDTLDSTVVKKQYKVDWENEMHPRKPGFAKVAAQFQRVLGAL